MLMTIHPFLFADWEASVHAGEPQRSGRRSGSAAVPVCPPGGWGEGCGPGNLHLHRSEPARSQISVHSGYSASQSQTEETMRHLNWTISLDPESRRVGIRYLSPINPWSWFNIVPPPPPVAIIDAQCSVTVLTEFLLFRMYVNCASSLFVQQFVSFLYTYIYIN